MVSSVVNRLEITHLLDYGCGSQCNLAKHLKADHKVTYQAYDPGVPKFSRAPVPAQMVACIDVLEHIEPDRIDAVLDHICSLSEGVVFLSTTSAPAVKVLSDGRNAHLIQEDYRWWLPKFWQRWDVQSFQMVDEHSFFVIGMAKPRLESKEGTLLS